MLCQQLGEVSLSLKPLLIIVDIPVHEAIGQSRVSMDVYVEVQLNILAEYVCICVYVCEA